MPDDMDRVQERVDLHLARAIEAHRLPATPGARICVDCDEPIPERRRIAQPTATRCFGCQQAMETKPNV